MTCPLCGSRMVKDYTGEVLTSLPPQYPFRWWCGCGYRGAIEIEHALTREEALRGDWERAQEGR